MKLNTPENDSIEKKDKVKRIKIHRKNTAWGPPYLLLSEQFETRKKNNVLSLSEPLTYRRVCKKRKRPVEKCCTFTK